MKFNVRSYVFFFCLTHASVCLMHCGKAFIKLVGDFTLYQFQEWSCA